MKKKFEYFYFKIKDYLIKLNYKYSNKQNLKKFIINKIILH